MNNDDIAIETAKGWAVELRRGRYIRMFDATTDRVEGITSHPEEARLFIDKGMAMKLAEENNDEADEIGFPRCVYVVINTTVIVSN